MKTQKYILLLSSMMFSTQLGCSTHPEIKPFEAPTPQEIALENSENSQESIELPDSDDGFVEDAELPAEEPQQVATTEPVETKKAEPAKVKVQQERAPASATKNGYFVFASACDMKASPSAGGKSVGNVAKGKKLWLDSHNAQWFKAYKKSGTAYVPADCVK